MYVYTVTLVAGSLCTLPTTCLKTSILLINHLYIFGHIKSRLGKMMLIDNESLEEGDGDALLLE